MKKLVLFALLVAAAALSATSAQAQGPYMAPDPTKFYNCTYINTHLHELDGADGGFSKFNIPSGSMLDYLQGNEGFLATYGVDQRKVTFAKPVNLYITRPNGVEVWQGTRWELTINPSGPQCKNTIVRNWGAAISFLDCTDGSSRSCVPY